MSAISVAADSAAELRALTDAELDTVAGAWNWWGIGAIAVGLGLGIFLGASGTVQMHQ
jgi:hypothetical protein